MMSWSLGGVIRSKSPSCFGESLFADRTGTWRWRGRMRTISQTSCHLRRVNHRLLKHSICEDESQARAGWAYQGLSRPDSLAFVPLKKRIAEKAMPQCQSGRASNNLNDMVETILRKHQGRTMGSMYNLSCQSWARFVPCQGMKTSAHYARPTPVCQLLGRRALPRNLATANRYHPRQPSSVSAVLQAS